MTTTAILTDAPDLPAAASIYDPTPPVAPTIVLFGDHPIRFIRAPELPWLALQDVCDALGLDAQEVATNELAACHRCYLPVPDEDGFPMEELFCTPIGAWTLTLQREMAIDIDFQKFVFRETKALQPDAFDRDKYGAKVMMAIRPDGKMPPRPGYRSGRVDEWTILHVSQPFRRQRVLGAGPPANLRQLTAEQVAQRKAVRDGFANTQPSARQVPVN